MAEQKIIDHHTVAPMEASFIAQAEQHRMRIAEPVSAMLASLRSKVNLLDGSIEREASELNTAWQQVNENERRKYQPEFSHWVYWTAMFVLVAIEIPLNAAALDFARLAIWETYVVAAGFGALNFFGAKAIARIIRQKGWSDRAWRDWFIAFAVAIALAVALAQFAILRQADPELGASAGAFLALQATFFVVVAAVSYFHIDPDADREQLHRRIARGQKLLNKIWKRRATLAKTYNAQRARVDLKLKSIVEDTHDRIAQYRVGNLYRRKDAAPSYMRSAVPPGAFRAIHLPPMIDEEPRAIREIIAKLPKTKENDQ